MNNNTDYEEKWDEVFKILHEGMVSGISVASRATKIMKAFGMKKTKKRKL